MDVKAVSARLRGHGLALFTPDDLAVLWPRWDRRLLLLQLHQWFRKGWVVRLRRGVYELASPEPAGVPDFHVANRLYQPSYVSLEAALSHYQLLPDVAVQVTSITPKPTRRFLTPRGLFTYFTVRPKAFAGYRVTMLRDVSVRIADPEKAVVDRLYAGLRRGEPLELLSDRWDRRALRHLNRRKLLAYAGLFGPVTKLAGRVHALLR